MNNTSPDPKTPIEVPQQVPELPKPNEPQAPEMPRLPNVPVTPKPPMTPSIPVPDITKSRQRGFSHHYLGINMFTL